MNRLVRHLSPSLPFARLLPGPQASAGTLPCRTGGDFCGCFGARGIRVQVRNGNLDQALALMERKMRESGMERLIRRQVGHHLKNSEKRVLARKNLELRIRSQDLARKLRTILIKKIRGH